MFSRLGASPGCHAGWKEPGLAPKRLKTSGRYANVPTSRTPDRQTFESYSTGYGNEEPLE
jgi:hypothetical protein